MHCNTLPGVVHWDSICLRVFGQRVALLQILYVN